MLIAGDCKNMVQYYMIYVSLVASLKQVEEFCGMCKFQTFSSDYTGVEELMFYYDRNLMKSFCCFFKKNKNVWHSNQTKGY